MGRPSERERQLLRAQRLAGIGSWEWDIPNNQISWSPELFRIFGVDPEGFDPTYEAYLERIHPEDREAIGATVQEAFATGASFQTHHRVLRPDGEVVVVVGQGAVDMEDGKPVLMYGTAQDVTQQEAAREAHKAKELFFELSLDLLCVASIGGYFLELNPAWTAVLGWSRSELKARPFLDFVHPDDRAATLKETERLGTGAMTVDFENRYRCKDGTYRRLRWTASPDPSGAHLYAVARDVTEEHRQQARFEAFLESAPDAMFMVGSDGRIQHVNGQAEAMFGHARQDLLGETIDVLVPQGSRGAHPAHRGGYMAHPTTRPMGAGRELKAQRKDGSLFPVEISLSPVVIDGDRMVIAAVRDITQRKEIESEAQQAMEARQQVERLQEVSRFKTQLLNTASHELNTPITPLRMQLHLLAQEALGPLTEKQARSVAMLRRNVDRLSDLVSDVLDVARLESGKLKLEKKPVQVCQIVDEVHDMFTAQADAVGVRLTQSEACDAPAEADRNRLTQVLINFTSNALKFTPKGGHIHMEAKCHKNVVRVEVQDDGRGLDQDEIARLFQAFSQVHDPAETLEPGTGLGLYIAKGILEQHGGRIGVESKGRGHGSTFWFELPVS